MKQLPILFSLKDILEFYPNISTFSSFVVPSLAGGIEEIEYAFDNALALNL